MPYKETQFYLLIFSLTILGCNLNTGSENKPEADKHKQVVGAFAKPAKSNNQTYKCTRILISYYDNYTPRDPGYKHYGPFSTEVIYETKKKELIDKYDKMTTEALIPGYCCCPHYNYTIAFYDGTHNYQTYFVDTVDSINKVRIFTPSYQFSYVVDKKKWNIFLGELDKISFNEYFISSSRIGDARKVYEYTIENDLPIITSRRASKEWMTFDGDFKVKVAVVGEKLDENKVYTNIYKTYPNDTFKIETISRHQMCGSYKGNDCYEEIILQLFCNKDFYDKFNIYGPKSFYDEAFAEFYILGKKEDLNKIDRLEKKEDQLPYSQ